MALFNGTSSSDTINGTGSADTINGNAGNDFLYGLGGNDLVFGGTGNDFIDGGNGSDVLDGGAGNDVMLGGAGTDTLVYRLAENIGATDSVKGGNDIDTLRLEFTLAEWLNAGGQVFGEIERYRLHLLSVERNSKGEVSDASPRDFRFSFGNGTFLDVAMIENFSIVVDGQAQDPVNAAPRALDDAASGIEDGPALTVNVQANDVVPDLVRSLAISTQPQRGVAEVVKVDAAVPASWQVRYVPNPADWQYLGRGEVGTDMARYTVTDADGQTATATLTVTVTGTNDPVTITSGAQRGTVVEDAAQTPEADSGTASGRISFADADYSDDHTASFAAAATNTTALGAFSLTSVSEVPNTAAGSVGWSYTLNDLAAQYLSRGQTVSETYAVTLDDGKGSTVVENVVITIVGTFDFPLG